MRKFFERLLCKHKWGNSNRITHRKGTSYDRCRLCGATRRTP